MTVIFNYLQIPNINIPMVDVRDVAEAHLKAMLLPEAYGNRHILYTDGIWLRDIAKVCNMNIVYF